MAKAELVTTEPVVKLELSMGEAQLVRDIMGSISGDNPHSIPIWQALDRLPGLTGPKYMLEPRKEHSQPNFIVVPHRDRR